LPGALGAGPRHALRPEEAAFAESFFSEFLASLGRALEWLPAEFAAERGAFDRDLEMYARWGERPPAAGGPSAKDGASPFRDRCALLLDPSLMEEARRACAGFEHQVARAAAPIFAQLGRATVRHAKRPRLAKRSVRPARKSSPRTKPKSKPKPKPKLKSKRLRRPRKR
jgi:hypothetical protein